MNEDNIIYIPYDVLKTIDSNLYWAHEAETTISIDYIIQTVITEKTDLHAGHHAKLRDLEAPYIHIVRQKGDGLGSGFGWFRFYPVNSL